MKSLRVLIATPLYPPEVGGPAKYAKLFKEELPKHGASVLVARFNQVRSLPPGIRHIVYFFELLMFTRQADVILALDYFSVGLPAAAACLLTGKKLFVRVGGDFWEQWIERTREEITLTDFYKNLPRFSFKERIKVTGAKFVFSAAYKVIFSTKWQREMVQDFYKIDSSKVVIIENPLKIINAIPSEKKSEFIWAGRMAFVKNLYRMVEAFAVFSKVNPEFTLRIIGEGPERGRLSRYVKYLEIGEKVRLEEKMSKEQLAKTMASAHAVVVPSFSEVSPNVLAEAISLGVPFIATKYIGWPEGVEALGVLVDPLDTENIKSAFELMCDQYFYRNCIKNLKQYSYSRSEGDFVQDFCKFLET